MSRIAKFPKDVPYYVFNQSPQGDWQPVLQHDAITFAVNVQADNAEQANRIAEKIGVYFDGVKNEIDCPCCGDRWSRVKDSSYYYTHSLYPLFWSTVARLDNPQWYVSNRVLPDSVRTILMEQEFHLTVVTSGRIYLRNVLTAEYKILPFTKYKVSPVWIRPEISDPSNW